MGINSLNLIHSLKKKTPALLVDLYCARCSVAGAEDTEGEGFHRWEWLEMSQWPFEALSPFENWTARDFIDRGAQGLPTGWNCLC